MRAPLALLLLLVQSGCGLHTLPIGNQEASDGGEPSEERQPPAAVIPGGTDSPAAPLPAQILDLSNWRLTLPTGSAGNPDVASQPALASFSESTDFHGNAEGNAVVFQAHAGGVSTISAVYPRSELREMTGQGSQEAAWSPTSGTHTMTLSVAVTHLTETVPHLVVGEIHSSNANNVVAVRLEGTHLFLDLNGTPGPTLDASYQLGRIVEVKFVASGGMISVFFNRSPTPVYSQANSNVGCYFKAGAALQSNSSTETNDAAFGQVQIYVLQVNHS